MALLYAICGVGVAEGAQILLDGFLGPEWFRFLNLLVLLGFPVALVLAWILDVTPRGVERTQALSSEERAVHAEISPGAWGGLAAAVVVVVAAASYLTVRWERMGAVALSQGDESDVPRVAVLPFQNRTGDPNLEWVGDLAAEQVWFAATTMELATVVDYREVMAVRAARGSGADTSIPLGLSWPEITRASYAVTGSFIAVSDSIQFQMSVLDDGGEVLAVVDPFTAHPGDLRPGLTTLMSRATLALAGIIAPEQEVTWSVAGLHAPSLEALRKYMEGADAYSRLDFSGATERFLEARALDSLYIAPLTMLTSTYLVHGDYGAARALCEELAGRRVEMSEQERLWAEADCSRFTGDLRQGLRAARTLAEGRNVWWYEVGVLARMLNRCGEAAQAHARFDPSLSGLNELYGPFNYAAWATALHHLGAYQEALDVIERAKATYPDGRFALHEATALIGVGRVAEAEALVDDALSRMGPTASPVELLANTAWELDAHGNPEMARARFQQILDEYENRPNADAPGYRRARAALLQWMDRDEEAEVLLEALAQEFLVELDPDDLGIVQQLAILRARQGRRDEALALAETLETLDDGTTPGRTTWMRGQIAAQLGDLDEAVRLLDLAVQQGREFTGRNLSSTHPHLDPFLKPLRGYPAFEDFIRPKG